MCKGYVVWDYEAKTMFTAFEKPSTRYRMLEGFKTRIYVINHPFGIEEEELQKQLLSFFKSYFRYISKRVFEIKLTDEMLENLKDEDETLYNALKKTKKLVFFALHDFHTLFLDMFLNINRNSCLRYDGMYSVYKDEEALETFIDNHYFCILSNESATKIYGRVFLDKDLHYMLNLYQLNLRYMFKYSSYNDKFYSFYLNEIILLDDYYRYSEVYSILEDIFKSGIQCSYCNEYFHEDDIYYVNDEPYCESCLRDNFIYCSYGDHYIYYQDMSVYEIRGETYCEDCIEYFRIN